MRSIPHQRGLACMALGTILALYAAAAFAEDPTVEQLQREMKAMKAQFEQMQQKLKQQDELIQKLSKEKAAPPPVTTPCGGGRRGDAGERGATQAGREGRRHARDPAEPAGGEQDVPLAVQSGDRADHRHGRLVPGASAAATSSSAPPRSASPPSIDPFARGYAIINGNADEVEVEEAAIVTTSLPYNLTVEGRPLLRRLRPPVEVPRPRPAVRQPADRARRVRRRRVAGRRPRAQLPDAARPVRDLHPRRVQQDRRRELRASTTSSRGRSTSSPTSSGRRRSSTSTTRTASTSASPRRTRRRSRSFNVDGIEMLTDGKARQLVDVDVTYRYIPLSQASYRGLVWGTEVLYNRESLNVGTDDRPDVQRRERLRPLQLRRAAHHAPALSRASSSSGCSRSTDRAATRWPTRRT